MKGQTHGGKGSSQRKTDHKKFEKYIDKLYSSNVYELKIVENFQIQES